jgi:taurine dioxygenase
MVTRSTTQAGAEPVGGKQAGTEPVGGKQVRVDRLAGSLGAAVTGVDLTEPLDDHVFELIKQASLEHLVLCIPGQAAMTEADQLHFAERWGEVSVHPYVPSIDGYPGLMRIYDPNAVTQTWHSDTTHAPHPPSYTILLARVIPPYGGDTMFSNTYLAYENLSPGLRATLDTLRAVHEGTALAADADLDHDAVTTTHPVVRTHPETGRKALYVNGNYTTRFADWTVEDSAPLLEYLYERIARPEYTYRHRWSVGDVIIWDNRSTQHAVIGDTGGAERTLHRVTIKGEAPS